jgi:hypothetical protein
MRNPLKRLQRLDELINPYLAKKKQEDEQAHGDPKPVACRHAAKLGALMLRGDPQLEEPLDGAWQRCLDRFEVRSWTKEAIANSVLEARVLTELPGYTEQAKFQNLLDRVPHWLLSFTSAWRTAFLLDLNFPDISEAPRPGHRGFREMLGWPELPKGMLQAGVPIPLDYVNLTHEEVERFGALRHKMFMTYDEEKFAAAMVRKIAEAIGEDVLTEYLRQVEAYDARHK